MCDIYVCKVPPHNAALASKHQNILKSVNLVEESTLGPIKYDIVHTMRNQAFLKQPLKWVWLFTKKQPLNKF